MDRAKQFLPFDALKGFKEAIKEADFLKEEKKDLTEDQLISLNDNIKLIKKGMMVKAVFYNIDHYEEIFGLVSRLDLNLKYIMIVKTKIDFKNLYKIEIVED
jgi:hypothetical protein